VTVDPTQLDIVLVIEVPEILEPLEVAKAKLWIRFADADGHHHLSQYALRADHHQLALTRLHEALRGHQVPQPHSEVWVSRRVALPLPDLLDHARRLADGSAALGVQRGVSFAMLVVTSRARSRCRRLPDTEGMETQ
jgi:hypothetical protein